MNKGELIKVLKPLIKECVKEVIFEEGVLSGIISEVIKGTSSNSVLEAKTDSLSLSGEDRSRVLEEKRKRMKETRTRMTEALGNEAYAGVFEGVAPLSSKGGDSELESPSHAISGYAPEDAGVNINGLLSVAGEKWGRLKG